MELIPETFYHTYKEFLNISKSTQFYNDNFTIRQDSFQLIILNQLYAMCRVVVAQKVISASTAK
ncbi:hypothetical protein T12_10245 [Trichinella patagoniensis]|uniref:Uncharacterized protein n=1 Tax=Trichinella patagoniensis TaxID=990121 RepID=A0A0V0ZTW6_9BILA|nr:hypothetical protein T12_10245 [Trichinella patagoniensis]